MVTGTSTFRVRCTSTGGGALDMEISGPNGYSSDISSNIQPVGTPRFLGSDSYTATTEVIHSGRHGDVYQCNATSVKSKTGSVTVEGSKFFIHQYINHQCFCSCCFSNHHFTETNKSHHSQSELDCFTDSLSGGI